MKPAFTSAAAVMVKDIPGGKLAAVDATKNQDLAKQYEVKGYPTLKYFK